MPSHPPAPQWTLGAGLQTLCKRESSDDPNAINKDDRNATGPIVADDAPQNCSRGVAQCIPPTFAAHHVTGTSVSIYDPVANIAAAMQYVRKRYHVSSDGSDLAAKVEQAERLGKNSCGGGCGVQFVA
jgi:SLT domain-containing protein